MASWFCDAASPRACVGPQKKHKFFILVAKTPLQFVMNLAIVLCSRVDVLQVYEPNVAIVVFQGNLFTFGAP